MLARSFACTPTLYYWEQGDRNRCSCALDMQAKVICVTKTWLYPVVADAEVALLGHALLRNGRERGGGGGAVVSASESHYMHTSRSFGIAIST